MILIARHQEGICLNPKEYLLNTDNKPMEFNSTDEAKGYIMSYGVTQQAIDDGCILFVNSETNEVL